jgi:hypothetical protein
MPSTPFAYPQVISRTFASFDVPKFRISADQRDFCGRFDSRQLHKLYARQISTGDLQQGCCVSHREM